MFNFIKKYKERKKKEQDERKKNYDDQRGLAGIKIRKYKELMLSKPCPINQNEKCFDGCVHFCEGNFYYMPPFYSDGLGFWNINFPKCKLWER